MISALAIALVSAAVAQLDSLALHPSVDDTPPGPTPISLEHDWHVYRGDCPANDGDAPRQNLSSLVGDVELGGPYCLTRTFEVPAELVGQKLLLRVTHVGGFEAELDGELVRKVGASPLRAGDDQPVSLRFGEIIPVDFDRAGEHRLTLRMVTEPSAMLRRLGLRTPIAPHFETVEIASERHKQFARAERWPTAFSAIAWFLTILHWLLFLSWPESKANLWYSGFTFSGACLTTMDASMTTSATVGQMSTLGMLFLMSLLLLGISSLRFYYAIFEANLPGRYWMFVTAGIFAGLGGLWFGMPVIALFVLVSLLEQTRVMIRAAIQRRPNAYIICIGGGLVVVTGALQLLPPFLFDRPMWPGIYLLGMAGLFVSITVYLAKTFADTHRNLASREVELKEAAKREVLMKELESINIHLRDTQAQLVRTAKMASLGELVAGIAHEINTPIGAIHSIHQSLEVATTRLIEILGRHPEVAQNEPQLSKALAVLDDARKVVGSGSSRVAEIVRRLKSFARLDEAELQRASVEEGLDDTLVIVRHQLKKGIEVVKHYGGVPTITCYPSQLNQVFLNLLVNGIHALGEKGTLTLTTRLEGKEILIMVADDGVGIPKEQQQRIFDPGFTTKGVKVGTGLGLSISEQIVAEHRGRISVASEPGKGACFSIYLPADLEDILARERDQERPPSVDRA